MTNNSKRQIKTNHAENINDCSTNQRSPSTIRMCCLNARSVKNKSIALNDFILSHELDIMAITETWLGTSYDSVCLQELLPSGYKAQHVPRSSADERRGGGIAIIFKDHLSILLKSSTRDKKYTNFEHMECILNDNKLSICILYRPPPTKDNGFTTRMFLEEWHDFLESLIMTTNEMIILGDFNFHLDVSNDIDTRRFTESLDVFSLRQHIIEPTHYLGHILDVIITRHECTSISDITVTDPCLTNEQGNLIRDHYAIAFSIDCPTKTPNRKKIVSYRKLADINVHAFREEIRFSQLSATNQDSLSDMINNFNITLGSLLDQHAPIITREITPRPNAPWYTEDIRNEKHKRRKMERTWRTSRLEANKQLYRQQCNKVNNMIIDAKKEYYSSKITECGRDQKKIFKLSKHLLGFTNTATLPSHSSPAELAERFSNYFSNKILSIRSNLITHEDNSYHGTEETACENTTNLDSFTPVTEDEIKKLIMNCPNKSCTLDPIPTSLLKECLPDLLHIITSIVNKSLLEGCFPDELKTAHIRPLLKKHGLDHNALKNYRPVSNLSFLSKLIEKAVAIRLDNHLSENELYEPLQSAYRSSHSTETALLKVNNDIITALDRGDSTVLIMLDLSAAFDTIDHAILLSRLKNHYKIQGNALNWITSYLQERPQIVCIQGHKSKPVTATYGVPQGSVLGPKKYTMYTKPLGALIRSYGFSYHMYADDTQIYISFNTLETSFDELKPQLKQCIADIQQWMTRNSLKLNDDKTELIIFQPRRSTTTDNQSLVINQNNISSSKEVKNLGVILDSTMSLRQQINSICKASYGQLRLIYQIRKYLNNAATTSLVHSLIMSRLDYCNGLYNNLPKCLLNKLQRIQNAAARLITKTPRRDHITPVLKELHWIPVSMRCEFKILTLVFKSLHNMTPPYLNETLHWYHPNRPLRSEGERLLVVPLTRTLSYGRRTLPLLSATLWNNLPRIIRNSTSLTIFRKSLKTHLFNKAYT